MSSNNGIFAIVLVNTIVGREHEVASNIRRILKALGIEGSVYVTYGLYDIVVCFNAKSLKDVDKVVTSIRASNGVRESATLIAS
ncbi:MAG: Lrp/AsnC family transcriptional regulator [Desulfurococcales archaeon]|nr:Lrp/AsnC family transcriptional regulator [Desulfurococcales archaeon]